MMNVAERKLKLEKNVTLSDAGGEFTEMLLSCYGKHSRSKV